MGNTRKGRDIDAALRRKGFRRDMGGKHIQFVLQTLDGRDTDIVTVMSHGMMGQSLSTDLISRMARQLRLTKRQFLELIDCTMAEERYREILREKDKAA